MKRSVACISGSRADFHLMEPVFAALAAHPVLEPTLLATCAHLHPAFREQSALLLGGFPGPVRVVNMLLADDTGLGMAQGLGLGLVGLAQELDALRPDILLLQGDRGEMLAGAVAAAHLNIPVVHMSGGDFTGSIDNAIRNAVTCFAHLHLTTCAQSSERLLAMGEDPARIFEVGEPALDRLRTEPLLSRQELCAELGLDPAKPFLLATLHPVTSQAGQAAAQMLELLDALERVGCQTIFTAPNTDAGGAAMRQALLSRAGREFLRVRDSLGFLLYASALKHAAALVGNSSSGILEAPSFGLPVVNVGQRQHGRLRAGNVLDVGHAAGDIEQAVRRALSDEELRRQARASVNPYGDGHAASRTADLLARLRLGPDLIEKWRPAPGPLVHG